jgi:hypothetical protein
MSIGFRVFFTVWGLVLYIVRPSTLIFCMQLNAIATACPNYTFKVLYFNHVFTFYVRRPLSSKNVYHCNQQLISYINFGFRFLMSNLYILIN